MQMMIVPAMEIMSYETFIDEPNYLKTLEYFLVRNASFFMNDFLD